MWVRIPPEPLNFSIIKLIIVSVGYHQWCCPEDGSNLELQEEYLLSSGMVWIDCLAIVNFNSFSTWHWLLQEICKSIFTQVVHYFPVILQNITWIPMHASLFFRYLRYSSNVPWFQSLKKNFHWMLRFSKFCLSCLSCFVVWSRRNQRRQSENKAISNVVVTLILWNSLIYNILKP